MTVPLISVLVPAFDAASHIDDCLRSVVAQRGPFRLDVIVVDDGSRDETAALARAIDGVRVLRQSNRGPSAARNRAARAAMGEWLAFLDSDDLWPQGRLSGQLALLQQEPDLGLIFGDCARFDAGGVFVPSFFAEAGLDADFWGHPIRVIDHYAKLFRLNYIPTGSVLVRRDCFEQAGGFDEGLRLVEDLDLWLRIARRCSFGRTSAICQRKRKHAGNVSADLLAMTVANLGVLDRHRRLHGPELRRLGVRLRPYFAYEYCLLGDDSLRAGHLRSARQWYLRAISEYPSPRPLYHWLRSLVVSAGRALARRRASS